MAGKREAQAHSQTERERAGAHSHTAADEREAKYTSHKVYIERS